MILASIETILNVEPIANADKIELATVNGWQSVIKKGEYKMGDEIIFVPIDTVLQRAPWNEFLFKDKNATEVRLKTAKLRGVYSQGLIINRDVLGIPDIPLMGDSGDIGMLAEFLGVTKYEKPVSGAPGLAKGGLPSWLRKSDEDNMQTYLGTISELQAAPKVFGTLKMDGSSFKAYWNNGEFGVCSRSLDLQRVTGDRFWETAIGLDLEAKLAGYGQNLCICGELCGPGIQKNPLNLSHVRLYIYDIWNIDKQIYLSRMNICAILACLDLLPMIPPVVFSGAFTFDIKTALDFVNKLEYAPGMPAEGIVFRPEEETYSDALRGRLSAKLINQNYKD